MGHSWRDFVRERQALALARGADDYVEPESEAEEGADAADTETGASRVV